jgi:hypothetical protein
VVAHMVQPWQQLDGDVGAGVLGQDDTHGVGRLRQVQRADCVRAEQLELRPERRSRGWVLMGGARGSNCCSQHQIQRAVSELSLEAQGLGGGHESNCCSR